MHYQSPLLRFKPIFSGKHIPFLFVAALTYLKTIIMSLLSFLPAKQLKSQHQSFTGCIFQPSDYSCCFLLKSLQRSLLSLMNSAPHYTLLQLRPLLGYLGPGDYFTSLPDHIPCKMFACFSGKGMTSVLQTWPRRGCHIYTPCSAYSCFVLAIGNAVK